MQQLLTFVQTPNSTKPKENIIETQDSAQKPQAVTVAVKFLWVSLAIGLITRLLAIRNLSEIAIVGGNTDFVLLFSYALIALLIFKISQGKNWARVTFLLMFVVGMLTTILGLLDRFSQSPVVEIFSIAQDGLQGYALFLLFTHPGNAWFRMPIDVDHAAILALRPFQVNDKFSLFHVQLQLILACYFFVAYYLDQILNFYFLLIPIVGLPAIIVGILWIRTIILSLFRKKWRMLVSAVIAPLIIWPLMALIIHSGFNPEWVRFEINKRNYEETVRRLDGPYPHQYSWDWGTTGGAGVVNVISVLKYDESDKIMPKNNKESMAGRENTDVRNFGNHFYLVTDTY